MRFETVGLACILALNLRAAFNLTVRTKNDQTTFRIGELIELELSFSSASSNTHQISTATYDRSGRLGLESYHVEPKTGWDDPLEMYFQSYGGFIGGGLHGIDKLSTQPTIIHRDLNEWVRFNQPGRYRIVVTSSRVSALVSGNAKPEPVQSEEISLTIVPATAEWQAATLQKALDVINDEHRSASSSDSSPAGRAIATLRYLGTPAAAAAMARRLTDQNTAFQYKLGLAATPDKEAALKILDALLNDPEFPVNGLFLEAMSLVALPADKSANRPQDRADLEAKFRREFLEALGRKRGAALAVSAYAIVDEAAMRQRDLPPDQKERLTADVVAGFDSLPPQAQTELLQSRWQVLDKHAMLPLLSKIARQYKDVPELREMNAYQSNQISAGALTRWWEMDPQSARPAIIEEIVRPKPRFGASVLGMLPDKELPEVDPLLADHLTSEKGSEEQIASLISRYATPAIEPQVARFLDERVGKWACAIQAPLLAYLLRVDPVGAVPLLEKAMAARVSGFSACNHSLLTDVAVLHDDPALEHLATRSLNDSDPQITGNAATYLGKYGSQAAEEKLWDRFAAWSQQWRGRAAELHYDSGDKLDGVYQEGAGSSMLIALATGQNWMMDETKLNRLLDLSVTPNQRNQAEGYLRMWQNQPRRISFIGFGIERFQIAQYENLSLESAVKKLMQFPRGTSFLWSGGPHQQDEKAFETVSKAVADHGIKILRSPSP
jgi:hypothetical protein